MSRQTQHAAMQRHQTGLTLIELMVAMVVGLAVISAGLAMYTTSGFASRGTSALAQMGEDATLALGLMRNHVAMAGYSQFKPGSSGAGVDKFYTGLPVFGCRNGVDATTQDNHINDADAAKRTITCGTSAASTSDTLIVMYEADGDNTIPTSSGATTPNAPTDCLGAAAIRLTDTALARDYFVAENRFFIDANGSLACLGTGNAGSQPLVDNVTQMRVWYGVAEPDPTSGAPGTFAQRYLAANQMGDQSNANWTRVVSARICLVIRSKEAVLDTSAPYINCEGTSTPTTDRRLYRAFTTTVVLNNRIFQN